jgi:hypothetical protein
MHQKKSKNGNPEQANGGEYERLPRNTIYDIRQSMYLAEVVVTSKTRRLNSVELGPTQRPVAALVRGNPSQYSWNR